MIRGLTLFLFVLVSQFAVAQKQIAPVLYQSGTMFASPDSLAYLKDGNGSLGQIYNNSACGLNYCQATLMTATRYTPSPGAGFPASLNISCLPACYNLEVAYLWWSESSTNNTATATVVNPSGGSSAIAAVHAGSGASKCWGLGGTQVFRADVTSTITGNGNYDITISSGGANVDGVTLFIIYTDPTATYQGSLIIHDGAIVTIGGAASASVNGYTACGNSTYATAFAAGGDMQNSVGATHTTTLNGTNYIFPQNFWNYDETTTTVPSGQTTSNFGFSPPANDCWVFALAGLYFQTTYCVTCTPPSSMTTGISGVDINCGVCDGTATVTVTGGTGPYTYQWDDPGTQTTSTAVGLCAGTYNVTITDATGCNINFETIVITDLGTALTVTPTATDATCFGGCNGTLSATTTGGTVPYTYKWTVMGPGQNQAGVCAGTYTVTVTDANGCLGTATIDVLEPNPIDLFAVPLDESCQGSCDGQLFASVTGGTGPFTYTWIGIGVGQSQVNICAGTYTVTVVDANGCIEQNTLNSTTVVGSGPVSTAGFTYNGNQCLTGNSYNFQNTGTSPATYFWNFGDATTSTSENPSHTYPAPGIYTVTQVVSNGSCSDFVQINITVYPEPTAALTGFNLNCATPCDGTVDLMAFGGTPAYTYLWSTFDTIEDLANLCAGTYDVTLTDANGCTDMASVTINAPPALAAPTSAVNASCNGVCDGSAIVTPSGGTGAFTYSWNDPGFQTTATATGLCANTFSVTVTDGNGCTIIASQAVTEPVSMILTPSALPASCGLSDGAVAVTATGGTMPYTYLWDSGCATSMCTALAAGPYTVTVTDNSGCEQTTVAVVNSTGGGGTASIQINANASCALACDGQATASITGGNPSFTYAWSDPGSQTTAIATGLCAGSYSVVITDGTGCISSATTVITEPPLLTASVTGFTDANCNGVCDGNATVTAAGGAMSYSYSWNNTASSTTATTASDLCAGVLYNVTVTDIAGCTVQASVTVGEPPALTASIVGTDPSCNLGTNGAADLTVGGGTLSYTYAWSNALPSQDLTNIAAGTYSVTITDGNFCIVLDSVVINEPPALTVTVVPTDASCGLSNGMACATPVGGTSPYTYLWNDSLAQTSSCAFSIPAGAYSVTVTDVNGCTGIMSTNLSDIPGGNAVVTLDNNASGFNICDGQATATLTSGTAPYTYLWNDSVPQTTATATGLCAGNYCVTITDAVGCVSSDCIVITEPPAMGTAILNTNLLCFNVCIGTADLTVVGGIAPYTYIWTGGAITQDVAGLCAGIFYVTVTDANSIVVVDSVIITEPPLLSVSVTGTDVICNGSCDGTATATAGGGTPPYTYVWDDPGNQTGLMAVGLCSGTFNVTIYDANACSVIGSQIINEPPPVIVAVNPIAASCGQLDGSVSAVVTNGVGTFTYSWNSGCTSSTCTGLVTGTYNVTVTDGNGCIGLGSGIIADANGPAASMIDSTAVSCFGGNDGVAMVSVTDGLPPYTYTWSTGGASSSETGMPAGLANVAIEDANGCLTGVTVLIGEPPALTLNLTVVEPSCNGSCDGVAISTVGGGTGAYSYLWDDPNTQTTMSASGLCDGPVSVVVTDGNGCIISDNTVLTEPLLLTLSLTETGASCGGLCDGSATVVAFGGTAPYTYSWTTSPVQTNQVAGNLCAGNYVSTITDDKGCTVSSTVSITEPSPMVASIISSGNVSCNGGCDGYAQASAIGGTFPYTYLWSNSIPVDQITNVCAGTYTISISDINGCFDTISVIVSEPAPLVPVITPTNVTCFGYCDGEALVSLSGGSLPYTYLWNDSYLQSTATADSLCAGSFGVTVTDINGCIASASTNISEPQVLAFVDNTTPSTCGLENGSACVAVVGGLVPYTITWNDPNTTVGLCIDSVYANVYNPILVDGNGCIYTNPVIINDIAGPVIDSVATTDLDCFGDASGTATVFISGGTFPFTYTWEDLQGNSIGPNSSVIFGLSGGTYTIMVEDGNSCNFSVQFSITEPQQIQSAILNSSDPSCFGACDGSISVIVASGTAPYTYLWSSVPAQTNANATGLCGGQNNVIITDANNCQIQTGMILIDPAEIVISGTTTDIMCNGGSDGSITIQVTGGTQPFNYVWLPPGTIGTVLVTNLQAGSYTVQVTDANACDTSDSYEIFEPAPLSGGGTSTPSSCGNANGEATVNPVGGTPPYSYAWYDSGGNFIGQTTQTATGLLEGYYNVEITDFNSCIWILTLPINNNVGPTIASLTPTNLTCANSGDGEVSVLAINGTLPYTYTWSSGGSNTSVSTGLSAGFYAVTLTDLNGCVDTSSVTITAPNPIVLTIHNDTTVCIGGATDIWVDGTGGTLGGGGPNPDYTYQWDNSGSSSSAIVNPTISPTIYMVTVTDDNGCTETASIEVNIFPPITVSIVNDTICEGAFASLTAATSGGNGGPYTWLWNDPGTSVTQTIGISPISNTNYTVTVDDGCSPLVIDDADVIVYNLPLVNFTWACDPDPFQVQFTDNSVGPGSDVITAWSWDFGDLSGSSAQNPAHNYGPSQLYGVTLTVTTDKGCSDNATANVQSPPNAAFIISQNGQELLTAETTILSPDVDFIDASSADVISWAWNYGDSNVDSTAVPTFAQGATITHTYIEEGMYFILLTVENQYGCTDTAIRPLRIKGEYILFAPTAFTPNGDGKNDYFFPQGIGVEEEEFEFYVFDRWGDLAYKSKGTFDLTKFAEWGWDGKANGGKKMAQNDVYVWLIRTDDTNGDTHEYIGHVTLLK